MSQRPKPEYLTVAVSALVHGLSHDEIDITPEMISYQSKVDYDCDAIIILRRDQDLDFRSLNLIIWTAYGRALDHVDVHLAAIDQQMKRGPMPSGPQLAIKVNIRKIRHGRK